MAESTGLNSVDLDHLIEKKAGMTVPEIFQCKGEIHFRKLEHEMLKAVAASQDDAIVSLGGGTPCYANNHELLNGNGIISIYLKGSVATLCERLSKSKTKRPLIAGLSENELGKFIAKHLFDRSYYYNQATYKINIDGKSLSAIVNEITDLLA
ncbi:shikimate kinase [Flavobacterium sp. 3HN19-14]|uniref:shikimate kinase n=1 Tax=Flavobacterium sp. 3HN19-14 TaxID=3448133 RepID=UPI003EE01209